MSPRPFAWAVLFLSLSLLAAVGSAQGQDTGGKFNLPQAPSQWINSGPISLEALQGKAAVLWFYEEQCPSCRGKWPNLIALSKQYEGKPVVFIAVNSGNLRPAVEQYVRGVNCPWPVIVDPTRQFEKVCDVGEISLQNIHQVKTITPDGKLDFGDWKDLPGTVDKALAGAKWNVDPAQVPGPLKAAWMAVEFGDYAAGAATIKKGLNANKTEIKAGATLLNDYVRERINKALDEAKQAEQSGDNWKTFRAYQQIADLFKGYELPEEVDATLEELAGDEKVKQEQALLKQLASAKKSLQSTSRSARSGAINRLKKIVTDSPDSDAAEEAAELLKQAGN